MADVPETPLTRLEQYWAGILDKIEGGGNPNHVETITGTLANPWGDVNPVELNSALYAGELSCKLTLDATPIGGSVSTIVGDSIGAIIAFGAVVVMSDDADLWFAYGAEYDGETDGALQSCYILSQGVSTSLEPYASQILTTLTIIHHPMPSTTP